MRNWAAPRDASSSPGRFHSRFQAPQSRRRPLPASMARRKCTGYACSQAACWVENMRPQYIYGALLMPEVGGDEIAVLENGYETVLDSKKHRVEQPNYALAVIRKGPQGWYLSRKIEFSRTDLLPHRQKIYTQHANAPTAPPYHNYN